VITRRDIVTGGIVTGAAAFQAGGAAHAAPRQRDSDERVVTVLTEIRDEMKKARPNCNANDCPEVDRIRSEQRAFLKARGKFPDYLEVGCDPWDRVCDWHIEHGVPLQITRMADGRYVLPFFQTTIVLRPDSANTFIGQGYDR
jgi:hypothetical protein